MTLKDIAKQLTTAVQTVPNLVQILRDGFEQTEGGSSDTHNYSTTEHVVGKWIDGKDIYEITVTGLEVTLTSNEWSYYTGISGIDELIDLEMYSIVSDRYVKIGYAECTKQEASPYGIMMQATSISNNRVVNIITARYTKQS